MFTPSANSNQCVRKELSKTEWFFFVTFMALSFWGISVHEIWLDEMHHWLLARDSNSLPELYKIARQDWHPLTWNVLLYIVSRFSHDPFSMQILHIVLSSLVVFIFFSYAPLSLLTKIFFAFGYYTLYEYNVISRNYNLIVLFCFMICVLYPRRARSYPWLSLLLLGLANTHYLGTLISLSLAMLLVIDFIIEYKKDSRISIAIASFVIYAIGLISTLAKVFASKDMKSEFDFQNLMQLKKIGSGLLIVVKGMLPVPDLTQYSFWNTNWLISYNSILALLISVVCIVAIAIILFDRWLILFFFLITLLNLILFSTAVGYNGYRYFGSVYILFILSLWLSSYYDPVKIDTGMRILTNLQFRLKTPFIYFILLIQSFAGISAFILDWHRPFSEAKCAVNYMEQNHLTSYPVAVDNLNTGTSISGYLEQKVFYPILNDWGSYRTWNTPHKVEQPIFFSKLLSNKEKLGKDVIVILHRKLNRNVTIEFRNQMKISEVAEFDKSIILDENCFLYKVVFK
jgi:hypothetical protein